MKKIIVLVPILILVLVLIFKKEEHKHPRPTETLIKWDMEDGTKPDRKTAIEKMHRIAEGESWRDIEYNNAKQAASFRKTVHQPSTRSLGEIETIVEGHVRGEWIERGSTNQAGNVLATEYDPQSDEIYTISAGGTLWKGARDGSSWEAINQDFNFYSRMLHLVDLNGHNRIIAAIEGKPHYSDDGGATWILATGTGNFNDGWRIKNSLKMTRADGSIDLFYLARAGWSANVKLMHSNDLGVTYERIKIFDSSNTNNFAMHAAAGTEELYLLEQLSSVSSVLWKWDHDTRDLISLVNPSNISFGQGTGNLQVVNRNGDTELYAYDGDDILKKSQDLGLSWIEVGPLPLTPWEVALYVSPSNPDIMFTGGVNAFRSYNGGQSWDLINEWWEYYDQVETKLHADMMVFNEFATAQGEPFLLVSNHGGLSVSYNEGINYLNIAMEGLNVAQYYSVATSPADVNVIYAGSQDQGFQRGLFDDPDGALDFEQVISGDYGHIVFTENHQRLWTVYPGGWVSYYPSPSSGDYTETYEIISDNESVWIPPMLAHPDPIQNKVYIAGGSADGGTGMHIIEMEMTSNGIVATNLPHNFLGSQGSISAMEISPFDHDEWHVMTSNGRYYNSADGGLNFSEISRGLPGGNYLYGSDIMASKIDPSTLYISGSGYSTAPVIVSHDGGLTFQEMSEGLPSTLVFGLAANVDESLIFAASEAGPFVYVVELGEWFNLLGAAAPYTRYWSVEYVEELKTVRYGTYGRGIWDFRLEETIVSSVKDQAEMDIKIYPNPTLDIVYISLDGEEIAQIKIVDNLGKLVYDQPMTSQTLEIDMTTMMTGSYYLIADFRSGRVVKTLVKK